MAWPLTIGNFTKWAATHVSGLLVRIRTVIGSTTVVSATSSSRYPSPGAPIALYRSIFSLTVSASSLEPSWKTTPLRRWNVWVNASGDDSQEVASQGISLELASSVQVNGS